MAIKTDDEREETHALFSFFPFFPHHTHRESTKRAEVTCTHECSTPK